MGSNGTDLDRLPPESRFAIRACGAGFAFDDVAAALRLDGDTVRKHLRTVVRETGGDAPPPSAGDDPLRAALAPALALARTPPGRTPGTDCPSPEILRDLALGRMDGPLMLATAEHAADCPACMQAVVAARRAGPDARTPAAPAARPRRGIDAPLAAGALAGLAVALWYLFLR